MSLKVALETLGFGACYHMIEVFEHPEHADFWQGAWRGEPDRPFPRLNDAAEMRRHTVIGTRTEDAWTPYGR